MAQIYYSLLKAPTALRVKTTLHSHHIGAAALGQSDRGTAGNLHQSHLLKHHRAIASLTGIRGDRIKVTCPGIC